MKKILLAVAAFLCMSTFAACNSGASTASEATSDSTAVVTDSLVDSLATDSVVVEPACDCVR